MARQAYVCGGSRPATDNGRVIRQLTGHPHRLFWLRSALWCEDCRQKIESCCDGDGCPSVSQSLTEFGEPTGRIGWSSMTLPPGN